MDNYRRMEGVAKGFANHRRIRILFLLEKEPGLSVEEVAEALDGRFETIAAHLRRLTIAGLVMKRSEGRSVRHRISDRARSVLRFLEALK